MTAKELLSKVEDIESKIFNEGGLIMEKKIAGSIRVNISDQLVANKLKALELGYKYGKESDYTGTVLDKEAYEKAEEILKWAYGISENSGK